MNYWDNNGYKRQWEADQGVYNSLYANGYNNTALKNNVDDLFDDIMNYGDFSYDANKDHLFQMFKQQYAQQGQRAMQDQMGLATAQTGGYNNSYAQTSAQAVNQQYMNELGNKAIDTYQNAFNMYQNDFNNKVNNFNIANDMYRADQNAYYNQLNNAREKAANSYGLYQDDYRNQLNAYSDNRNYEQAERWNKKNYELSKRALK